jgi:hypothetical protein
MSKESKETSISVNMTYNGLDIVLTKLVSDYELEQRLELLVKQVKVLQNTSGGLEDPE